MTKILPIGVLLGVTAVWWLAASGSTIFPTPPEVLRGIAGLATDGTLLRHVAASLYRVTFGYGVAMLLALPLGILMGWYRTAFTAFNPLVQMLRPISPIAWIPLAILWFGVSDLSPMFLVFLIGVSRDAGMRYDLVVAGMVMIGDIGLLLARVMRRLEDLKEVRWRYARGR